MYQERLFLWIVVPLIIGINVVTGNRVEEAMCPDSMENFNRTKFVGIWYVSHTTVLPELPKMHCYQSDDAFFPNGTYVSHDRFNYVHSEQDQGIVDFVLSGIFIWSSQDRGEFYAQIPLNSVRQGPVLVLDTDYDTYAIIFHCFKVGTHYVPAIAPWEGTSCDYSLFRIHGAMAGAKRKNISHVMHDVTSSVSYMFDKHVVCADGMIVYRRNEELDAYTIENVENVLRRYGNRRPLLPVPRCDIRERMMMARRKK